MGEWRRRHFLAGTSALFAAALAHAQQPRKVYRVGLILGGGPTPDSLRILNGFREEMRLRGWIEGSNYVIEARWGEGKPELNVPHAKELVRLGVDVLTGTQPAQIRAAMEATRSIPIVMIAPPDPVQDGFIASYARPGGNVTGLSYEVDMSSFLKQFDFIRQTVKGLARLAWLTPESTLPYSVENAQKMLTIAKDLGIDYRRYVVKGADELEPAFWRMKQERMQAVTIRVDGMVNLNVARVAELALRHRLPSSAQWSGYPAAGGLMSFGPELDDQWRRAADYVDRLFKGANPAEMPVQRPTKFRLVVNLKTAKALGLTLPQAVLLTADQVIE